MDKNVWIEESGVISKEVYDHLITIVKKSTKEEQDNWDTRFFDGRGDEDE